MLGVNSMPKRCPGSLLFQGFDFFMRKNYDTSGDGKRSSCEP